jgi:hypothetical protein
MIGLPNGELIIHTEINYRFHHTKMPLYLYVRSPENDIYTIETMTFKKHDHQTCIAEELLLGDKSAQELLDDLYRAGFKPSDETKKDELINVLQKEIEKRDKLISNLLNQFCLKGENTLNRSIIT